MEHLTAVMMWMGIVEFDKFFYYVLNEYETIIILGILTFSFAFLGRNKMAFLVQTIIFIGLWCHALMDIMLQLFLVDNDKLHVFSTIVMTMFWVIQITSLALVMYEMKQKIDRETPK